MPFVIRYALPYAILKRSDNWLTLIDSLLLHVRERRVVRAHVLDTSAKYSRSRLSVYAIYLKEDGVNATLTVRGKVPLGNLRNFFFECLLIGISATVKFLFPDLFEQIELGFTWPQPDYFERYRDRLPKVTFRASDNQLRLPSSSLARKSPFANAAAHSQAIRQLNREMALLNLDASDLVDRVRAGLMRLAFGRERIRQYREI